MGTSSVRQCGLFSARARRWLAKRGPGAVTVDSITQRLPSSKELVLSPLRFARRAYSASCGLETVLAYQEGIRRGHRIPATALAAALHTPAWGAIASGRHAGLLFAL